MTNRPPVIFVTGATATGKSDFALQVARETGGVIINCDSVQVYRGPEIGSNVPSSEERALVRHELYSYVDAPREMTAGEFRREYFECMEKQDPEKPVFVVGGTGFYFQALEKGMFETPVDDEMAQMVRIEAAAPSGLVQLRKELEEGDPESAKAIMHADVYRLCRAIEVLRSGVRLSDLRRDFQPAAFPFPLLKTGVVLDRSVLAERIHQRTQRMIQRGLRNETQGLLDRGLEQWAPLAAVGYKQTVHALRANESDSWLAEEISLRTRQLAKRQENWFKRDRDIQNFDGLSGNLAFRDSCLRFLEGAAKLGSS